MNINDRIKKICEVFCENSNGKFAVTMEASKQNVNNWSRSGYSVGLSVIVKIIEKFPSVSPEWLLTGVGEMERTDNGLTHQSQTDRIERLDNHNTLLFKENKELRAENDELRGRLYMKKSAG
ncbi:hypothetical protein Barb4_01172 [Bacteroidales bacterium Barb4]|nr:hypothetical protein Barb4_01172 [Bacteroidales bacterium Barb4]